MFVSRYRIAACLAAVILYIQPALAISETDTGRSDVQPKKSTRIDFEDERILGQSISAGAVYLSNRKKNELGSMLDHREDYRKDILKDFEYDVYDQRSQP